MKHKEALQLTAWGFKIFPLVWNGKVPLAGSRGFNDATDDETIIREWCRCHPNANIGIATGEVSDLTVIDVDVKSSGEASMLDLEAAGLIFTPTAEVITWSGGRQLYHRYDPSVSRGSVSLLAKGIDIRSDGGYVVAPPSEIDLKPYRWLRSPDKGIAELPAWVAEALNTRTSKRTHNFTASFDRQHHADGLCQFVATSREGTRNHRLFWAACRMAEQDNTDEGALLNAARACGLTETEARRTIQSAFIRIRGEN